MFKSLTAAVLTLAIALPASAQSRGMSDSERAIGALLGIAGAAIIINEISKSNRNDRRPDPVVRPAPGRDHGRDPGRGNGWGGPGRGHQAEVLPAACEVRVSDRRGNVTQLLGRKCLERSTRISNRLPSSCFVEVRTRDGLRTGYVSRCLERAGYRIGRR